MKTNTVEQIVDVSKETLLTVTEAAEILKIHERTLAQWRKQGIHLPYIKLGNKVRYRESDILSFKKPSGLDLQHARVIIPANYQVGNNTPANEEGVQAV